MFPLDLALAVAIIVTPGLKDTDDLAHFKSIRITLESVAIYFEILDLRERYLMARDEDFNADLKLIIKRWERFKDTPPASDVMRLPVRGLINSLLGFNRDYRRHIEVLQTLNAVNWWETQQTLQECDDLYRIWDTIRDARCEYYYITVRRQELQNLREMIGDEAYYAGSLPPHVPVWRFGRMD
jgi:hypothetical protein